MAPADNDVAAEAVNPDGSKAKVDAYGRPETSDHYDPDAKAKDAKAEEKEASEDA